MKRIICLCIVVSVLLSLGACRKQNSSYLSPKTFYYCKETISYNSTSSVISSEIRDCESYNEEITDILNLYLSGPVSKEYISPFPRGVELIALEINESGAHVLLSAEFSDLSGIGLTVASACLSMTLFELTECETVTIQAENSQLDGLDSITITQADLLLIDEYTPSDES